MGIIIVTWFVVVFGLANAEMFCTMGKSALEFIEDPNVCSKFHICFYGQGPFTFSCGAYVWDPLTHGCVPRNSPNDHCTTKPRILADVGNFPSLCDSSSEEYLAHPKKCAQYYNCSDNTVRMGETHLMECTYPMLFNDVRKRCDDYAYVNCGSRNEPKDPCDYSKNECGPGHCEPCNVRFPSCRGLEDGTHPWLGKEWSADYVVCENERVLETRKCSQTPSLRLFDPKTKLCEDYVSST